MKVAFISRETLFTGKGGDTIQILNTAKYLRLLGVEVDVYRTSEKISYDQYDIIHGFNIIRPADLIPHFDRFNKKKVLSTIYVDYFEYESRARKGLTGAVFRIAGGDLTEYMKTVMRWIRNGENNFSWKYLLFGHKHGVKHLVRKSDLLLPNSASEYNRLARDYRISKRFAVIPNAIDPEIFSEKLDIKSNKEKKLVICVAKIDGRKNQLNLIRALNNTEFNLVIIGKNAPNHRAYYEACRKEAAENISFVTEIEQTELLNFYLKASVHAMPSWFETTGLSSLEAAALGCNVVISENGDTRDYFGTFAEYAEPDDVTGIYNAVKLAAQKPFDEKFRKKIYSEYIWKVTAEKTLAAYKSL